MFYHCPAGLPLQPRMSASATLANLQHNIVSLPRRFIAAQDVLSGEAPQMTTGLTVAAREVVFDVSPRHLRLLQRRRV